MALLPRPIAGWYTPLKEGPRGTRARHERPGRNDRCPCGSGAKIKHCHREASREQLAKLGPRAANLDQILDVARPLHIDPGVDGYLLFQSGSCFLVTFRGDLWIVASAHSFKNQGALPQQARVLATLSIDRADVLIPIESVEPLDQDDRDTAWRDFVLLRTTRSLPSWVRVIDLDTTALADLERATPDDWLRVCGFPNELGNEVEYSSQKITLSRLNLDGRYNGRTESKFVHAISFDSTGVVQSLNGMSGGPVFFTRNANESWCFAGVLISEGAPGSGLARFVDARKIESTLRWHYDENPTATVDTAKRRPR